MSFLYSKISVLFLLLALLLSGCGGFNQVNVHAGEFDVYLPPIYTGAGSYMAENSSSNRVSAQLKVPKEEKLKLTNVWNKAAYGDKTLPKEKANIFYRMHDFPVTASYDYLLKSQLYMTTIGGGLDPFPYMRLFIGMNKSMFEVGYGAQFGFGRYKYSLEGPWLHFCDTFEGDYDCGEGDLSLEDEWKFSFTFLFSGYLNVFLMRGLSLSYAPGVYLPWLFADEFDGHEVSFNFPCIIEQYVGASYLLNNRIQLSAGVTFLVSEYFAGKRWVVSTGVGYLF